MKPKYYLLKLNSEIKSFYRRFKHKLTVIKT